MTISGNRVLLTGGAGFIGSHLSEALDAAENDVIVADKCSSEIDKWLPDSTTFVRTDLTQPDDVSHVLTEDIDIVFHLASRKSVNDNNPRSQFIQNTEMMQNVLDRMCEVDVSKLCFTSSSTVYGEAPMPTPESHAPLEPISVYGAAKLANEGLISTYAYSYGIQAWTFRFANIVGPRLRGAVIPDFIEKLQTDPEHLTILGDGRQEKSYMHIDDCIEAMFHIIQNDDSRYSVYNLGTETTTSVTRIADIVCDVLDLEPEYKYTGGRRGWTGDVPKMRLSIEKLRENGWKPSLESDEAVRLATSELAAEIY